MTEDIQPFMAAMRAEGRLGGILPGMQELVRRIGDDERRHMAWGTSTCRRHVAADDADWTVFEHRMNELIPMALLGNCRQRALVFIGEIVLELQRNPGSASRRKSTRNNGVSGAFASARGGQPGGGYSVFLLALVSAVSLLPTHTVLALQNSRIPRPANSRP